MNQQTENDFIIEQNKICYLNTAEFYEVSRAQHRHTKVYLQHKIASAKGNFSDSLRVLDIGVGTGFAMETAALALRDFRTQFVGCDISPHMLDIAKSQMGFADFALFNGLSLPF